MTHWPRCGLAGKSAPVSIAPAELGKKLHKQAATAALARCSEALGQVGTALIEDVLARGMSIPHRLRVFRLLAAHLSSGVMLCFERGAA